MQASLVDIEGIRQHLEIQHIPISIDICPPKFDIDRVALLQ